MYDAFEARDTVVIAIAQEDKDLKSHGQFLKKFEQTPPFDIVADIGRKQTERYDRTTSYLIDKQGMVREIFPATVYLRPNWLAVQESHRRPAGLILLAEQHGARPWPTTPARSRVFGLNPRWAAWKRRCPRP